MDTTLPWPCSRVVRRVYHQLLESHLPLDSMGKDALKSELGLSLGSSFPSQMPLLYGLALAHRPLERVDLAPETDSQDFFEYTIKN